MEQRDSIHSSRSKSRVRQTRTKNISPTYREPPHLAASLPAPGNTTAIYPPQSLATLNGGLASNSEPFLRFPRPQGNKRLANWISSSDPNIMDLASENSSDAGLVGSTFELISREDSVPDFHQHGTDSESQDESQHDFFEGSVSESVESLDQFRQDDVQSIASTDQMEDEEEDGLHHHHDDGHDEALNVPNIEGSRLTDLTAVSRKVHQVIAHDDDECEVHSDAESRSSIEYTSQSLGTPSISTPEASKILIRGMDGTNTRAEQRQSTAPLGSMPSVMGSKFCAYITTLMPPRPSRKNKETSNEYHEEPSVAHKIRGVVDILMKNPRQLAANLITIILVCSMVGYSEYLRIQTSSKPNSLPMETSTTPVPAIIESATHGAPTETKAALRTSTGVALIPIHESHSHEGLFGYSVPTVAFTPEGESGVLIRVMPTIPRTWTDQQECVKIEATRGDQIIPIQVNFQDSETIHLEFARADAHGIAQISLASKCRPKFEKSVKIHFSKGIVEQVLNCAGELAHVLTGLQPSKVERCQALKSMSDNVDRTLTSAKYKGFELVTSQLDVATRMLGPLGDSMIKASHEAGRRFHQAEQVLKAVSDCTQKPIEELRRRASQLAQSPIIPTNNLLAKVHGSLASSAKLAFQRAAASQRAHQTHLKQTISDINVERIQKQFRFGLLDAQVSAKTWWLKLTGREDQSKEYDRRAKEFIAELHAYSSRDGSSAKIQRAGKGQCRSNGAGEGRNTHQCVPAA